MKRIFLVIIIVLSTISLFAQTEKFFVRGEVGQNKVKLVWIPQKWNMEITAFEIKKRKLTNNIPGPWEKINDSFIIPGISSSNNLNLVEKNSDDLLNLEQKRVKIIERSQNHGILSKDSLNKIFSHQDGVSYIAMQISLDYKFAQLLGFAFSESYSQKDVIYEYGVFSVYDTKESSNPLGIYKVNNKPPDLNVKFSKHAFVPHKKSKLMEINMFLDPNSTNKKDLLGFDLYRKTDNSTPEKRNKGYLLVASTGKDYWIGYKDSVLDFSKKYTYSVIPLSLFGSQGTPTEIIFDPADYSDTIPPSKLEHKVSFGDDFVKNGVQISWQFDPAYEKFIQGFVLERTVDKGDKIVQISKLLPAKQRAFKDVNVPFLIKDQYLYYRLKTIVNTNLFYLSNYISILYHPVDKLQAPKNLTAQMITENDQKYILLKWDTIPKNKYYKTKYTLFCNRATSELAHESLIGAISENQFKYEIKGNNGLEYMFCVAAIKNDDLYNYGKLSDTLVFFIPTTFVFKPLNVKAELLDKKIKVRWDYPYKIKDLAGFQIKLDKFVIDINAEQNMTQYEFTSEELPVGSHYISINAFTKFNYKSSFTDQIHLPVK